MGVTGPRLQFLYFSLVTTVFIIVISSLLLVENLRTNTSDQLKTGIQAISGSSLSLAVIGIIYVAIVAFNPDVVQQGFRIEFHNDM